MTATTPALPLSAQLLARLEASMTPAVELRHWQDDADAAFARLAVEHPDRCTPAGTWTPGGAR